VQIGQQLTPAPSHVNCSQQCAGPWRKPSCFTNAPATQACNKYLKVALLHFCRHQTHHRAQAGALPGLAGIGVGVTDLSSLAPNRQNIKIIRNNL